MRKVSLIYSIPLTMAAVMALLLSLGGTQDLENRLYDVFLAMRPSPPQNPAIVLVEVDDPAVSTVGTWPISRSITADGLFLLKEMGAQYAVFDIEYINKSPRGVDASVLEESFPARLAEGLGTLANNNSEMAKALQTRRLPLSEATDLAAEFRKLSEARTQELTAELQKIAIDNDERLAQAAAVFGSAFLTVNIQDAPDNTINPDDKKRALASFSLKNITGTSLLPDSVEISPVIDPILSAAKGIGFTNVKVDADGVRRRIDLVKRHGDAAFGQLGFSPFLDWVGNPEVEVRPDSIVLKAAHYPDGKTYDVTVPRAQDGSVLINWPHTLFNDSFRHLSFYYLYEHDRLFSNLVHNLEARGPWGYLDVYSGDTALLAQAHALSQLRDDLLAGEAPAEAMIDYRSARDAFLKEVGTYLDARPDRVLGDQLTTVLAAKGLSAEQRDEYLGIQKDLPDWYAKTKDVYDNLMEIRTDPKKLGRLDGSFCILGNTNTGSTDLGVTPFQKQYPNVGTHASTVNMLLARQFVVDASPWWSWLLGLGVALALAFVLRGRKPAIELTVGGTVSVAAIGAFTAVFVLTGLYLPVVPFATLTILSFLGTTFFQFLNTEKEKGFLRSAFSRYLSNDVIEQIIANPGQLKLGGQQKVLTAVFTDIKGFSTISEKMTPEELVFLLNQYLTGMSDIILDLQGTIDKYEGDAIIAFFGAPVSFDDHARRACLAAVRMKRMEDQLNARFLEQKVAPAPLATRIGINTGPMVVGNMGTDRMMNYTMIGDAVNLAARLEGVNKLYGTWVLISEDTKNAMEDAVVTRKLDRVRVVGKSVPIRLYQAIEEKGHVSPTMVNLLRAYDEAFELFEARQWSKAKLAFQHCLDLVPDDGPSLLYRKRSEDFEKTPPPDNWDGVFKMEVK